MQGEVAFSQENDGGVVFFACRNLSLWYGRAMLAPTGLCVIRLHEQGICTLLIVGATSGRPFFVSQPLTAFGGAPLAQGEPFVIWRLRVIGSLLLSHKTAKRSNGLLLHRLPCASGRNLQANWHGKSRDGGVVFCCLKKSCPLERTRNARPYNQKVGATSGRPFFNLAPWRGQPLTA